MTTIYVHLLKKIIEPKHKLIMISLKNSRESPFS